MVAARGSGFSRGRCQTGNGHGGRSPNISYQKLAAIAQVRSPTRCSQLLKSIYLHRNYIAGAGRGSHEVRRMGLHGDPPSGCAERLAGETVVHFRWRRVERRLRATEHLLSVRNAIVKVRTMSSMPRSGLRSSAHGHDDASLVHRRQDHAVVERSTRTGRQVHILGACGHETSIAWGQKNRADR